MRKAKLSSINGGYARWGEVSLGGCTMCNNPWLGGVEAHEAPSSKLQTVLYFCNDLVGAHNTGLLSACARQEMRIQGGGAALQQMCQEDAQVPLQRMHLHKEYVADATAVHRDGCPQCPVLAPQLSFVHLTFCTPVTWHAQVWYTHSCRWLLPAGVVSKRQAAAAPRTLGVNRYVFYCDCVFAAALFSSSA
jgi:hypothetical protein